MKVLLSVAKICRQNRLKLRVLESKSGAWGNQSQTPRQSRAAIANPAKRPIQRRWRRRAGEAALEAAGVDFGKNIDADAHFERRGWQSFRRLLVEDRDIAPAGHIDAEAVVFALLEVVLLQALAQLAGVVADNIVLAGVVTGAAVEDADADFLLGDTIGSGGVGAIPNVAEKSGKQGRLGKMAAGQQVLDCFGFCLGSGIDYGHLGQTFRFKKAVY